MKQRIPEHIAIIMDGNRRWAKAHGKTAFQGHRQGYKTLKEIAQYCLDRGVKYLTVYAFSTENWKRSKTEVRFLVHLLEDVLRREVRELHEKNICIRFLGQIDRFSKNVRRLIDEAAELTKNNTRGVLNVALNYGGRTEIIDAVRRVMGLKLAPAAVTEELLGRNMYTNGEPDPDLVIRTSGEQRTSNFLPWQTVYSELYFTDKLWPDFTKRDVDKAIAAYGERKRRFGR